MVCALNVVTLATPPNNAKYLLTKLRPNCLLRLSYSRARTRTSTAVATDTLHIEEANLVQDPLGQDIIKGLTILNVLILIQSIVSISLTPMNPLNMNLSHPVSLNQSKYHALLSLSLSPSPSLSLCQSQSLSQKTECRGLCYSSSATPWGPFGTHL